MVVHGVWRLVYGDHLTMSEEDKMELRHYIFIAYDTAFILLFIVYKLMDAWIYQKVHSNLT